MKIFLLVELIILFILLLYCIRCLWRNERVAAFKYHILDLVSKTAKRRIWQGRRDWEDVYDLIDKFSYFQMLYSFKPLRLEKWYTEEEIEELYEWKDENRTYL